MTDIKILDCTLRDGGYHNDWDFDRNLTEKLVAALDLSGVNIIEIGYKSKVKDKFYGLYRYCSDSQLEFLQDYKNVEFSFMVDVKEFVTGDQSLDVQEVKRFIKYSKHTFFSWCRIATYYETVSLAIDLAVILENMGYKVALNIMGFSLLSEEQIHSLTQMIKGNSLKVFYISDSFGSFVPEDISEMVKMLRKHYHGPLGIHTHDNQGLAFANVIAAIKAGVEYIDASVMGMGRGAGNLKLEQLLLFLYFKHSRQDLNPYALLDIIQDHFIPMHAVFGWGWDFSYMLSGLKNIHPTYCQKLKSSHQYTIAQVANILTSISDKHTVKYNSDKLIEVSDKVLNPVCDEKRDQVSVQPYELRHKESVLIVAGGHQLQQHKTALRTLIQRNNSLVLECNNTGVCAELPRTIVALNRVRLAELHEAKVFSSANEVVTGMRTVSSELFADKLKYIEYRLESGKFNVDKQTITLPSYIVGMFAVGIALLCDAKTIYLAGFEGFESLDRKDEYKEMQDFWDTLQQSVYLRGRNLISILPTHYDLPVQSIYSFID
ncbi:MAG: hypothetical protein ABIH71_03100 [Candidatus Omnitrophota bacterium]